MPTVLVPCCVGILVWWTRRGRRAGSRAGRNQTVAYGLVSLFWWGFLGVFLCQVLGGVLQSWDAQRRYVAAPGRVIESRLKYYSATGRNRGPTYRPVVIYEYSVQGVMHRADRIYCSPGDESMPEDAAEMIRSRYPSGAQVTVFYDPTAPERALLDRGILRYRAFELFCLFPFVVIGLCLLAWLVHSLRAAALECVASAAQQKRRDRLGRVFAAWFVAQVLSIVALAVAGVIAPIARGWCRSGWAW